MSRFTTSRFPGTRRPSRWRFGRSTGLPGLSFAAFAALLLLGETGFLPAGSDAHVGLAVSVKCNPPTSMPSALFIVQATPSHPVLQSGRVQASYEFEVVNFTSAVNGTKVVVPNVLALFPLTSTSDFSVNLPSVELGVAGAGWSNPTLTSNSSAAPSNLSFSASNPPQLLTVGWLPNDPQADAIQADAVYGTITLAFRWSWVMYEPNGTIYTSPWSTPSYSAASPSLPSIFYPAELVASHGETSPVTIGGNFTDLLVGHVAARSFGLAWTDTTGRQSAHGQLNTSSGATSASASLALTNPTHRLAPGTFVFRVKDTCGALIQDQWRSASLGTAASVELGILPSACGTVILNGTVFADGAAPEERPSPGSYSLTSTGCPGYAFTGWSESGGVVPASTWARNTRLFVSWNGSVSAGWAPGYRVTFQEGGATKGQNWSVTIHGTRVQARAPNPLSFLLANGSYTYYVGNATGYSSSASPGTVLVKGSPVNLSVSLAPDIQHVVVIVMENSNLYPTLRYAPYMDYLWNTYAKATSFYAACHESKPEYLAMTSGRSYSCGSIPLVNVTHLGDLLEKRGLTWGSYLESMNTSCDNVSSHFYFAHHNPFLWYADVRNNATRCSTRDVNSRVFNQTLANGTLPTYSLYVPNNDDDCEWTVLPTCDTWLKSFLGPILNSTHSAVQNLVAHTAFVIAFDEAETNLGYSTGGIVNPWCRNTTGQNLSVCGGHIYLSVVSPFSQGLTYSHNATDYNLESTVEWLLGLGGTGNNDSTTQFPPMKALFHASTTPPQAKYSLHGRVTSLSTGLGIPGASVSATGGFTTTTNGSGYFALALPNGTYSVNVSGLGFVALTASVKVSGGAVTQNFAMTSQSRAGSTYRISGTVASWYNSSLLSGASVRVSAGSSLLTGSNGTYWFYEPNGSYTLTAWHAGSRITSVVVKVSGAPVTSNILLPRFYWEVSGVVTNATTGARIAGANVSVTSGPSSYNQYALTNATGVYVLWLANGTYGLKVSHPGSPTRMVTINVTGSSGGSNIALAPVPSAPRIPGNGPAGGTRPMRSPPRVSSR